MGWKVWHRAKDQHLRPADYDSLTPHKEYELREAQVWAQHEWRKRHAKAPVTEEPRLSFKERLDGLVDAVMRRHGFTEEEAIEVIEAFGGYVPKKPAGERSCLDD